MVEDQGSVLPEEYFQVPRSARIWNFWQGGKDNYPVDREAGNAWAAIQPEIFAIAKESRQFLIRAVRFLATEAGIRQFLDIGTGLPTVQNTHEVAQGAAPGSKVVYVDNDPVVLAHARALLTSSREQGVTTCVEADYHNPELIVEQARETLDFTEPIAVMFMGVLGHVADYDEMRSIISWVVNTTPAGSALVLWENTDLTETARAAAAEYAKSGAIPYRLSTVEQVRGCFDGFELVEPGLVSITRWRPEITGIGRLPEEIDAFGAVGRKW
jgi:hypothetical protein